MADVKPAQTMIRDFSKVILTLENSLIPEEKLSPTPSMQDGLDLETETDLRVLGCELIQTSGILLKLPQVAMATGQVLFQRFYYFKSFVKHNMEVLAMACVNLASKIEECPRRIRDVINVFHHVKQVRNQKTIHPLILDQNYINLKNQVIKAERRVLKELGFCVHVKHPHKVIVMYLQVLESEQNQKLVQCAWWVALSLRMCSNQHPASQPNTWVVPPTCDIFIERRKQAQLESIKLKLSKVKTLEGIDRKDKLVEMKDVDYKNYMNDSFRTDVFVRWHPETIACACIYLAARQLQVALPNSPPWYELFAVDEDEVKEICLTILKLYARKKAHADSLEKKVNVARNIQLEAKKKAKGLFSERDTPNSSSRQNSPKNISPNPTLLGSIKRIKKEEEERSSSDKSRKRRNGDTRSRSHSRSRSRSSRSRSFSPAPKKRKHHSRSPSIRKSKKDKYNNIHDNKYSPSERRVGNKDSHKSSKSRKHKYRSRSRSASYSPSLEYKSSHRKRSPNDRHSRKHRNGHHASPSRDRMEKYSSKYDKYDVAYRR